MSEEGQEEGQEAGQEEAGDETSMDDILANIRRVISEEDEEAAEETTSESLAEEPLKSEPVTGAKTTEQGLMREHPLPLSEEEIDIATPIEPDEPETETGLSEREQLDLPEKIDVLEPQQPAAAPTPSGDDVLELTEAMIAPADELMSGRTTQTSSNVLGELARAIMERREMGLGDKDVTLEGMVREMMRPLLREWLDRNLPHLIERLVKKEIDKMVNRAEMFEEL
jgi:cell pole-organizing protein PopZ